MHSINSRRRFLGYLAALFPIPFIANRVPFCDELRENNGKILILNGPWGQDCPIDFEPLVMEVVGADKNGELLDCFGLDMIAHEVLQATGICVAPENIFGINRIPGAGLYHLGLKNGARHSWYRCWVLLDESKG